MTFSLIAHVQAVIEQARYDKLDDIFAGRIPRFRGVAAFEKTLSDSEKELGSTLAN